MVIGMLRQQKTVVTASQVRIRMTSAKASGVMARAIKIYSRNESPALKTLTIVFNQAFFCS